MNKELTNIEATCPNCGQEMLVELPEGVTFKDLTIPEEIQVRLIILNSDILERKRALNEMESFSREIEGSWRNRKAWKLLNGRINEIKLLLQDFETEKVKLREQFNLSK